MGFFVRSWIAAIRRLTQGETIPIDGKTGRGSYDSRSNKGAIHRVSANRLVLGQCKVDEKSNKITAMPQLLEMLSIAGCIVTIDAIDCQREIAAAIRTHWAIEHGWHWVLDVAFAEDGCRIRKDHAPLSVLRQIALSLLGQDKSTKVGINARRKKAVGTTLILSKSWLIDFYAFALKSLAACG